MPKTQQELLEDINSNEVIFDILKWPNPDLKKISEEVALCKIDDNFKKFIEIFINTLKFSKGIGLAAPQVGWNARIIAINLDDEIKVYHLEHSRESGGGLKELIAFWLGINILYRKYLDGEIFKTYSEAILVKLDDVFFK